MYHRYSLNAANDRRDLVVRSGMDFWSEDNTWELTQAERFIRRLQSDPDMVARLRRVIKHTANLELDGNDSNRVIDEIISRIRKGQLSLERRSDVPDTWPVPAALDTFSRSREPAPELRAPESRPKEEKPPEDDFDQDKQAETLENAAEDGTPLCEECEKKAQEKNKEPEKKITGRFSPSPHRCGDPAYLEADGVNISEGASTSFAIVDATTNASFGSESGPMTAQKVSQLPWKPKKPKGWKATDKLSFTVSADGVSAKSENQFTFKVIPDLGPETITMNCSSPPFAWTGKFEISYKDEIVTVRVKIKLLARAQTKPATGGPTVAAGVVSAADKATMKADIESHLSEKVKLYPRDCSYGFACACGIPIKVVVDFVESGEHHQVNLYDGAGRANATNWTRVKTRDNSWAHETGHLLGWYDEYSTGAVGAAPRWQPNRTTAIMNIGSDVPAEYSWDFRDWFAGKSGEPYIAR